MPLIPSYNMMVHLQKICISAVTDKQAPGTRQKNATSNATGKSVAKHVTADYQKCIPKHTYFYPH